MFLEKLLHRVVPKEQCTTPKKKKNAAAMKQNTRGSIAITLKVHDTKRRTWTNPGWQERAMTK
ncbi:hypothetical protein M419DRAFT_123376 [Trichoderma reesei RUT C-30]|uniref:Uncharacterized protein n=1 Tax=Hypocrea jecorina (strain ATCC 56765 / BCRC 32924 / NRRL 11460 / Rut C-30) TaxID=1344414 RepID=A0A024S9N6_HYPJR|nr:hypothetical protein M419DRAFT_123376 [Trichoderma reesei RUT C-30]